MKDTKILTDEEWLARTNTLIQTKSRAARAAAPTIGGVGTAISFKRTNPYPLDSSSVFLTKEEALIYAENTDLRYVPYSGLVVSTSVDGKVYILKATDSANPARHFSLSEIVSSSGGSVDLANYVTTNTVLTITANKTFANIVATSFAKSGGTATQFLKADGSIDSTAYTTEAAIGSKGYLVATAADKTNWNTAYSWGNHASAGYLKGITKAQVEAVLTGNITTHIHDIYALNTELATSNSAIATLKAITITAGTGLTGGGNLTANRTLALATIGTAGTYTKLTVDAYGRVSNGSVLSAGDIPVLAISKITGLLSALDSKLDDTAFSKWFTIEYNTDGTIKGIKALYDFYSVGEISAYGSGTGEAPTGASYLSELKDVKITSPTDKQTLIYDATTSKWINGAGLSKVTVNLGTVGYDSVNGVISLPGYPTTLPASDVYAWAKAENPPSVDLSGYVKTTTSQLIEGDKTFGSSIMYNSSVYSGGYARGLHYYKIVNSDVSGGTGMLGSSSTGWHTAYIGVGAAPWDNNSLRITDAGADLDKLLTVDSIIKRGGNSSQLLRADGGVATFNWSGQSGQPTWLWGANNQHDYALWNPSNFNVNSARTLQGYTNQEEYTILQSNNGWINGPYWKLRYDASTADRWFDLGFIDGNGNFMSGIKVTDNNLFTFKGLDVLHAGNWSSIVDGRYLPLTGGIVTGSLLINPTSGNYSEGIRISNYNGWSNMHFGCVTNSTSGLNPDGKQWLIGKNPNGEFQICPNDSMNNLGLTMSRNSGRNGITWYSQEIWHAGNDGSGSGLDADLLDGLQPSDLNVGSATKLSTNRTNYKGNTDDNVIGQLMWKNFGNNHTIFDASNSTTPSGTACNNTNSEVEWAPTQPILMGWNGSNTYGVRVDYSNRANKLATPRSIWGQSFDGTANVSGSLTGVTTISASSTITAPTFSGALSGNASSATRLQSTTSIWGQNFDGTNIISGALTGATTISASARITGYDFLTGNGGWFRSVGDVGWYSETYGGGIRMTNATWVEIYSSKRLLVNNVIRASAATTTGCNNLPVSGQFNGGIEIYESDNTFGIGVHSNDNIYMWRTIAGSIDSSSNKSYLCDINISTGQLNWYANIVASGEITAYSDVRLKSNIQDLTVRGRLQPKTFIKDNKESIGFIALDILALYPELVLVGADDNHYLSVNYGAITAVLSALLNTVEDEISVLKNRIKHLEDRLYQCENSK